MDDAKSGRDPARPSRPATLTGETLFVSNKIAGKAAGHQRIRSRITAAAALAA